MSRVLWITVPIIVLCAVIIAVILGSGSSILPHKEEGKEEKVQNSNVVLPISSSAKDPVPEYEGVYLLTDDTGLIHK
jgi:hypothetical protein